MSVRAQSEEERSKKGTEVTRRKQEQEEKSRDSIEKDFNPEDFSLPTAVALGCCSFEAYNGPYKSYGIKEVSPCGCETIFMDRNFLDGLISGVLEIHLRRAISLQDVNIDGSKELPRGFSSVIEHAIDPVWRQTVFLYVRDPSKQQLEFLVEHITTAEDEENVCLGSATLKDLATLCDGEIHDLHVHLQGAGSSGHVEASVRYQEHSKEHNLLDNIKWQAVGQMMTDDWADGVADEWDDAGGRDWRFTGVRTAEQPAVMDDDNPIDIEGGKLAEGESIDRAPWQNWSQLRDGIVNRKLFTNGLTPVVFLVNKNTDTEVWVYRESAERQIVISFRGTSSPKDMVTDMALDLAAFNPGNRRESKGPEDIAEEMSDEEIEKGPLGGLYKTMKVIESMPGAHLINNLLEKGQKAAGRKAPKGLSGWAKSQMLMIWAVEHDELWVHKGFLQAYTSVSDVLKRTVDDIMKAGTKKSMDELQEAGQKSGLRAIHAAADAAADKAAGKDQWHIYTTGHSMGGALATLCADELASQDYGLLAPKPKLTMYSFGQPRVGNGPFATDYDKMVPDSWRIKNANDIVTRVPSLLGYQHIGIEVNLFPHGKVSITGSSTDDIREGAVLTDIIPRIKGGMMGEDEELKEEFAALVQGELDVWKSIMKGTAVQEHMEDVYHDVLKCCVDAGGDMCRAVVAAVEDAKREAEEVQQKQSKK